MALGQRRVSRPADTRPPAAPGAASWPAAIALDGLLLRVADGDAQAFGCVCDQVTDAVYGVVRRIVWDEPRADQVTGEVLLEVWQSASQFRPADGSGISWIMMMARRRAMSHAEEAGGHPLARPQSPGGQGLVPEQFAGSLLAHSGLAALPGPQREVVLLACCGYTWRQAADLLGIPADTAAERLRAGLLELTGSPR